MKSFVRPRWAIFLIVSAIAAASCAKSTGGGPTPPDEGDEGGSDPSGGSGGGGGVNPMGSGGAGGGAGGAGGGAGGASGGAGGNGAGGGAESALIASLYTMAMTMDCTPGGTPSIDGNFQAYYDNQAGVSSAFAIVKSAKLTMTLAAQVYTWSFNVAPKSAFIAAGAASTVTHTAEMGVGAGNGALCDYCGQIWKLEVQWDLGGKTPIDTIGPAPVSCVQ